LQVVQSPHPPGHGTGSSPDPTSGLPRPGCGPCRPCSGVAPLAQRPARSGRSCPNPGLHGTGARAWRAPFPGDGGESAGPAREPATAWTAAASTAQRERGGKLVAAVARVPLGVLIPSVPFSSSPLAPLALSTRLRAYRALFEGALSPETQEALRAHTRQNKAFGNDRFRQQIET